MISSKKIIIDGYNLIKRVGGVFSGLPSLEAQRNHLLRLLASSSSLSGISIVLVFDSSWEGLPNPPVVYRNIKIVFSQNNKKADEIIQQFIRRSSSPGQLLIVTSDREIQYTALDHGARIMGSQDFWKQIQRPVSRKASASSLPDRELTDREIKDWLKLFNQKDQGEEND